MVDEDQELDEDKGLRAARQVLSDQQLISFFRAIRPRPEFGDLKISLRPPKSCQKKRGPAQSITSVIASLANWLGGLRPSPGPCTPESPAASTTGKTEGAENRPTDGNAVCSITGGRDSGVHAVERINEGLDEGRMLDAIFSEAEIDDTLRVKRLNDSEVLVEVSDLFVNGIHGEGWYLVFRNEQLISAQCVSVWMS